MMTSPAVQLATCAKWEVEQRRRFYPRWVENRRITQAFADEQTAIIDRIARGYRAKTLAEAAKCDLGGGDASSAN
ncbi:hypothetical protein ACD578_28195 (plasmid) [Microvirga sp. RSM25]|uniref:hypothetical protein n=1 Tax=Microvirga sp. RSM25 TaxID=3273802 RepID=UPI00384CD70A